MKLDRDKFDEVQDFGVWATNIEMYKTKILDFIMEHAEGLSYIGKHLDQYNCGCSDQLMEKEPDIRAEEAVWEEFLDKVDRLKAELYCLDTHQWEGESAKKDSDDWTVFQYNGELIVKVFLPFFLDFLDGDLVKLRELATDYVHEFRGFCVLMCPECKRWLIRY